MGNITGELLKLQDTLSDLADEVSSIAKELSKQSPIMTLLQAVGEALTSEKAEFPKRLSENQAEGRLLGQCYTLRGQE